MLRACQTCGIPFTPHATRDTRCDRHQARGRASRSPTTRAQDAEYDRERARILAGNPPCVLRIHCNGAPATTADHVIPVAARTPAQWALVGGPHRGNLQPACAACNYSKQARSVS